MTIKSIWFPEAALISSSRKNNKETEAHFLNIIHVVHSIKWTVRRAKLQRPGGHAEMISNQSVDFLNYTTTKYNQLHS